MTKATLNTHNEVTRNYIAHLLQQLTVDYKNTKEERKKIASLFHTVDEEFTVLEEIELLTVDIRGYASQIQARNRIENEQEAIERLQTMQVFDVPTIAQFYFGTDGEYGQMKAYIQMLDYLRLLILEYLRSYQSLQQESEQS
ncbi:hypothetical protein ICL16_34410 [Iningainema sp. BLCCT55]|uniref:Uncharacterized protein n=2 Tax=Iningainema TaxID=1932705 RepID=A0A8J6XRG0_9CYAN|nr:hypothetical protein [Iningainema tapete]MBD2777010.1 hypothetical protein [Iningainema tapete BLCC-T55]